MLNYLVIIGIALATSPDCIQQKSRKECVKCCDNKHGSVTKNRKVYVECKEYAGREHNATASTVGSTKPNYSTGNCSSSNYSDEAPDECIDECTKKFNK